MDLFQNFLKGSKVEWKINGFFTKIQLLFTHRNNFFIAQSIRRKIYSFLRSILESINNRTIHFIINDKQKWNSLLSKIVHLLNKNIKIGGHHSYRPRLEFNFRRSFITM